MRVASVKAKTSVVVLLYLLGRCLGPMVVSKPGKKAKTLYNTKQFDTSTCFSTLWRTIVLHRITTFCIFHNKWFLACSVHIGQYCAVRCVRHPVCWSMCFHTYRSVLKYSLFSSASAFNKNRSLQFCKITYDT